MDCVKIFIISVLITLTFAGDMNDSDLIADSDKIGTTRVLSRTKRFITFPDGSSFQLVFCTQNHGYLQLGDIVWFGNTAALAWQLPSDPSVFNFFKSHSKEYEDFIQGNHRRQDSKHVIYYDEKGKILAAVPYRHRKLIVNPAFAKRSIDDTSAERNSNKISIKEMHEMQKNRSFLHKVDEESINFHRDGRKSLYDKVETLFEGLGWNGKECVLRMLCEHGKSKDTQGSFIGEIMRATFTLPKSRNSVGSEFQDYDIAHTSNGDCASLYPKCGDSHGLLLYN